VSKSEIVFVIEILAICWAPEVEIRRIEVQARPEPAQSK
jgi:hypothetical protein